MSARIAVAAFVWIIGVVFALVVLGVVIAGITASPDLGGTGQTTGALLLIVTPGLAGAALTKLATGFISRKLNPEFYTGPSVVGCAAGFALCWVLASQIDRILEASLLFILVIGPMTGALAGSLVPVQLPPLTAGALVSVVSAIAVAIHMKIG